MIYLNNLNRENSELLKDVKYYIWKGEVIIVENMNKYLACIIKK